MSFQLAHYNYNVMDLNKSIQYPHSYIQVSRMFDLKKPVA